MRGGGQNSDSNDTALLWLPITLIVLLVVIWFFFHAQIATFVFWLKTHELRWIVFFVQPLDKFLNLLHLSGPNTEKMFEVIRVASTTLASKASAKDLIYLSHYVGTFLRIPVIFFLGVMACFLFFLPAAQRFKNYYNMSDFRSAELENWPAIKATSTVDLLKADIEEGPWAMAKKPLDFCKTYQLLDQEKINMNELAVAYGAAFKVFALQLGLPWRGVRNCPVHVRALFVIFSAFACHDRDLAERLLDQISASASKSGQLDFSGVDALLVNYEKSDLTQWLERSHAYVGTLMMSLLKIARTSGVVATAQFLWLKPLDRRLWFTLNSVGRQTAVVEVAGVKAHWLAEKKIGRLLKTPMVKQAITGLELALGDIKYNSEEDQWRDSVV